MTKDELVSELRELAEWAEANIWEVPIKLPDVLRSAADIIERYDKEGDSYDDAQ